MLKSYRVNILDSHDNPIRYIAKQFRFEGMINWQPLAPRLMPLNKVPMFICKCGSYEWTENGRFINEYECPACGQLVEITIGEI